MISNNLEITVHIANLAVKQLINNICQLLLQLGVFGVTSLFISYNIKAKSPCVCVHVCISLPVKKLILIHL